MEKLQKRQRRRLVVSEAVVLIRHEPAEPHLHCHVSTFKQASVCFSGAPETEICVLTKANRNNNNNNDDNSNNKNDNKNRAGT